MMPVTPDQVKKLCAASGADEIAALSALERRDGDLLEAMLELERSGLVSAPAGDGFYSTGRPGAPGAPGFQREEARPSGDCSRPEPGSTGAAGETFRTLTRRSVENRLEILRNGSRVTSVPLLILLLLLVFFFWQTAVILAAGLLLGLRYRFGGPDLDREPLNRPLDRAADLVAEIKQKLRDHPYRKRP